MTELTPARRAVLRGLAEVIAPGGGSMPSAGEIGLEGAPIDRALAIRPDLAGVLVAILDAVAEEPPDIAVPRLADSDPAAFQALMQVVAGAYYMDERVRIALGYTGQAPSLDGPPSG